MLRLIDEMPLIPDVYAEPLRLRRQLRRHIAETAEG